MFGNSPAETRMGGANAAWDFARVREGVLSRGGKIVNIDYRLNETASGHPDEWLPIRPGTDAALCSALAHEWIVNNQVDKEFLDAYVVGFDDDTMPDSAKGQNKSYKDYIMGTGYDKIEKTLNGRLPSPRFPPSAFANLPPTWQPPKPHTFAKAGARNVIPMAKTPPEQFALYRSS